MKRTKQWWASLTKYERSKLTRLEREERQADKYDSYPECDVDNPWESYPDDPYHVESVEDHYKEHLSNLKDINKLIKKADDMISTA